ncbi:MAG: C_GCAxxG_C_C family protein [Deltaproteobacteria bacterium]|nr:C_GCAxxG_C_C family protein [Deltaproteobacteria bacterium]
MNENKVVRFKEAFKKQVGERAYLYEVNFHGCSQCLLLAFQEILGLENELLFKAAGPLCAGMGAGLTCGALTAGIMVIGTKLGRANIEEGNQVLLKSLKHPQKLVKMFKDKYGTTSCHELTKVDFSDEKQVNNFLNSPEKIEECCKRVGETAEMVAEIIADLS